MFICEVWYGVLIRLLLESPWLKYAAVVPVLAVALGLAVGSPYLFLAAFHGSRRIHWKSLLTAREARSRCLGLTGSETAEAQQPAP